MCDFLFFKVKKKNWSIYSGIFLHTHAKWYKFSCADLEGGGGSGGGGQNYYSDIYSNIKLNKTHISNNVFSVYLYDDCFLDV